MSKRKRRRASGGEVAASAVRANRGNRRFAEFARPVVALVVLAVIAYANAFASGFALDDISMIVENPLVRDLGNVREIFATNYWDRGGAGIVGDPTLYRPVTVLTYAIDFALWGLRPGAFHAVNVALHTATTVLLFFIAVYALGGSMTAFVAASIFAVHPIHTEAVTGVVGRAELLATLFFLGAFWVLRQRASYNVTRPDVSFGQVALRAACGAALYLLGLFSKETAVTLPLVLALDDWLHRDELPSERRSRVALMVVRYGALAIMLGVYLVLRQQAVSGTSQIWPGWVGVSAIERFLTASRVMLEYIGLFVFPVTLQADYWKTDVPIATSLAEPLVLVSTMLWVAVAVLVTRQLRRDPPVVLSVAWFFITIAPVSNVLFPIGVAKAERLLYLPSVGLCLVAGWAFGRLQPLVRSPWPARIALATLLVAFSARTVVRNMDWKDNLTLALATLETTPSSPLLNDIAAGELVRRGDAARALLLLQEAVRQAPDMQFIRSHLGATHYRLGQIDQAIAEYQEAIRRNPNDADSHNNLGVAYVDKRRFDDAAAEFAAAIRISPRYLDPHVNLGVMYLQRGQLNEAVSAYSAAVQVNASSPAAHNGLGVAYFRLGQFDRAEEHYREALLLQPDFAAARANLAQIDSARAAKNQ